MIAVNSMTIENYNAHIQVNPPTTLLQLGKKCQALTPDNLYKIVTSIDIEPSQNRHYFDNVETSADVENKHLALLPSCSKRIIFNGLHTGIKSPKLRGAMSDV